MIEEVQPKPVLFCPECEREMQYKGVMLMGNVLTGEPSKPVGRNECAFCLIICADETIDVAWGWQQWAAQGNTQQP